MTNESTPGHSPSPLAEASPESLDDLFSRDPLDLTEADIGKVVARLRAERAAWDKAEGAGAKSAPKGKAKAPTAAKLKLTPDAMPSLDDLGLS